MIRYLVATAAALSLALWLGACSVTVPPPKSPDQGLYEAHTAYVAALLVVTRYGQQPLCPNVTWADACANRPFLILAKKASDNAATALTLAQPVVDAWKASSPPTAAETAAALAAVQSAAAAVQGVTVLSEQIVKPTT